MLRELENWNEAGVVELHSIYEVKKIKNKNKKMEISIVFF